MSKVLNPNARLADVLMDDKLTQQNQSVLRDSARAALKEFNSTSDADYQLFFKYRTADEKGGLPSRIGYLLGLRVVEKIAAQLPLPELAHLQGPELKCKIQDALSNIAESTQH